MVALGCCYPAYLNSDWLIWLPMLVADLFWRQSFFDAGDPLLRLADEPEKEDDDQSSTVKFPSPTQPAKLRQEEIVQRLYRVRNEDGSDSLRRNKSADRMIRPRS